MDFTALQKDIHKNAKEHGWWDDVRPIPELLCLLHSEISEALEAYRNNDLELFMEELADVAIRLMDMAEGLEIDLETEIIDKHSVNMYRPYRHGNKVC